MKELLDKADKIKSRISELVRQVRQLSDENDQLRSELEELRKTTVNQEEAKVELERQIQLKKIATTLKSDKATKDTNERIDHLVREIDKCMALFRKQ